MQPIPIRPARIQVFGPPQAGETFCFVTNPGIVDEFEVEEQGGYADYRVYTVDREGAIVDMLANEFPERAHVLVASPEVFFRSPDESMIGDGRKLIAMACNSTPTPLEALRHFLGVVERTDPGFQEAFADRFFAAGEASEHLQIIDAEYGTRAVFQHLDDSYEWNQQAGYIAPGEQQIAPSGEISVLPVDIWEFSERLSMRIDGEIALRGLPILHSGEPSFLREDQARLWESLRAIEKHAVIAEVEGGIVRDVRASHADALPAAVMLDKMFTIDSRYRILWELGFAVNTALELLWGNYAMNEVYGGPSNGALHFGLGLTPYTQYHLDVICPHTQVLTHDGKLLFGTPRAGEVPAAVGAR